MRLFSLLVLLLLFNVNTLFANNDWGQTGHRVIGEVAAHHLTKKAKKNINRLLNGMSLAVASTFADEIKSDSRYKKFGPWHYVNVPFDKTYSETKPSEKGDIVVGIEHSIRILKDPNVSQTEKSFYLKLLIHFIGDLHQPLHLGLEDDKGGNDFQVRWFNKGTNLHRIWDSQMIESYQMTYTELSNNLPYLSKKEIENLTQGTLLDWVEDERKLTKKVYQSASSGEKLGYRYMYDHFSTLKSQLYKGGIRLAKILNEIFG